ncbi:MAG: potassium channel family protein [Flavobacterium sp.]|nr:potassium channel family protein [Flavobacterium sp.]
MKNKALIVLLVFAGILFISNMYNKLLMQNFPIHYVMFFLFFSLLSVIELSDFYIDLKGNRPSMIRNLNGKIIKDYLILLIGLFYYLGFLHIRQIHWNENFDDFQIKFIDYTIGIGAILSLSVQFSHLILILKSKFIAMNFFTYLILFFISYIICGFSFAALYCLDIENIKNINPEYKTFDSIYFSFVTLSTTGFGDISPNSILTKTVVIFENLTGLFLNGYVITMIFSASKKQ